MSQMNIFQKKRSIKHVLNKNLIFFRETGIDVDINPLTYLADGGARDKF